MPVSLRGSWMVALVAVALVGTANAGPARTSPPPPPEQASPAPPPEQTSAAPDAPAPQPSAGAPSTAPPPPGTPSSPPDADVWGVGPESETPVDLSRTWSYSRRRAAPEPRFVRGAAEPTPPHPRGHYSGVSQTGNQIPPRPPATLGSKPVLLTWTGFERTDDGSAVYFQLSADAEFSVSESPGRIVLRMKNTRVNVRNNARPLDLRFFDTPARRVVLRKQGRDLVATIELKGRATAVIEQTDARVAGYRMLVVRFDEAKPPDVDAPPPPRR